MGSNPSEENIWASTRVHHAEHAARRAAHDVEQLERGCRVFVPPATVTEVAWLSVAAAQGGNPSTLGCRLRRS